MFERTDELAPLAPQSDVPLIDRAIPTAAISRCGGDSGRSSGPADRAASVPAASGKRRTQSDRILSWARAGRVLHQVDWWIAGADGGPPIRALRSRVSDLEAEGFGFHHYRRPDGTVEYRLAHEPDPPAARSAPAVATVEDLDVDKGEQLELELPTPRPGFYDVELEAA